MFYTSPTWSSEWNFLQLKKGDKTAQMLRRRHLKSFFWEPIVLNELMTGFEKDLPVEILCTLIWSSEKISSPGIFYL
jgi:hypothetical protein